MRMDEEKNKLKRKAISVGDVIGWSSEKSNSENDRDRLEQGDL